MNAWRLLDRLFVTLRITRTAVTDYLGISKPTAGTLVNRFCNELDILEDSTPGNSRNKVYVFKEYLSILEVGTD